MPSRCEPTVQVYPNQLHVGDRFTNDDGEWEVASRPVTFKQEHELRARIQRLGDPGASREMAWPMYERLAIRRPKT